MSLCRLLRRQEYIAHSTHPFKSAFNRFNQKSAFRGGDTGSFQKRKMLSFDEFRAINNRERNQDKIGEEKHGSKSAKKSLEQNLHGDDLLKKETKTSKSLTQSIGEFLEYHSMQIFYIILLLLDTFGAFLELYYTSLLLDDPSFGLYVKALKSLSQFASMVFSFEIFLVYIAFGLSTFFHVGYLIDLLVLSSQMYLEYKNYGCEIKILNIFRLWRPVRLLSAMIAQEKEKEVVLEQKIGNLEERLEQRLLEIDNLKLELTKEKEAKNAVEAMLVNYKEEVDTLNEALKIAAMDIAEVGQHDEELFTSEDEENEGEEEMSASVGSKSKDATSLSTAERSKKSAKLQILRNALDENPLLVANESKSTFVIHEDGKFEKK